MHELSCLFPEENVMPFHPDQPAHRRRPPAAVNSAPEDLTPVETMPRLYTPKEAAALLRVRESWLRRQATARTIPVTFLGRHLRFSAANLASIIATGSRPAGTRRGSRRRQPVVRRDTAPPGNEAVLRDLTATPERSVHASRPNDPIPDGSSTWPG
jgi:excisionase family DNA binding protein